MKMVVVALDDVFDTGLAVVLDTLSTANELASVHGAEHPPFDVNVVGKGPSVRTALGAVMPVDQMTSVDRPDWVIVPALNFKQPDRLVEALGRADVVAGVAHMKAWRDGGAGLAAACVGTFVLAETGLLNDQDATTSWPLATLFRQRYPRVRLDESRMITSAGGVVTAGALMGHLDLALWLVRQASPELAAFVARFMLIDNRASQARYIIPDYLAHADPLIERFERWTRERLASGFSLQDAANALSVTPRTLQRRTEAVLGKSPLRFVQDMRVERAQHLVSTGQDLDSIAAEVGYADAATLRNLLRRRLGRGIRELRAEMHSGG